MKFSARHCLALTLLVASLASANSSFVVYGGKWIYIDISGEQAIDSDLPAEVLKGNQWYWLADGQYRFGLSCKAGSKITLNAIDPSADSYYIVVKNCEAHVENPATSRRPPDAQ